MVDGTALAPTVFGETDSTSGIWKFKSPSGVTWGTNGFHLKFENSETWVWIVQVKQTILQLMEI